MAIETNGCSETPGSAARRTINQIVAERRQAFRRDILFALNRTEGFAVVCAGALGEITRDEALDGIEREFLNELRRLR